MSVERIVRRAELLRKIISAIDGVFTNSLLTQYCEKSAAKSLNSDFVNKPIDNQPNGVKEPYS